MIVRPSLRPALLLAVLSVAALLNLCVAHPGFAHEGHEKREPFPAKEAHRPTPLPDRIVLTWFADPATTQAVTWRTDTSVERSMGQIALAEDGPKFTSKAETVSAITTPFESDLGKAHYHSVRFENLQPKSKYVYRVGDGTHWSEWIHFQTASREPEPFSFVYFGDAQNDLKSHWSRVIREAYSDAPKARLMIHAGDLINRANSDAEWGEWFGAGGWVNAMVPSLPTPGNHEYFTELGKPQVAKHWKPQFTLPENGPPGLEETVYFVDFQGVRFVSLNSNESHEQQVEWLERALGDNPNRWTILTFHHPIYSAAKSRDNTRLRKLWQPVFDRFRVDLVLQGHDHAYARTGLQTFENVPTGANVRDGKSGTVYVVSVSGPKMYDLGQGEYIRRAAEDTQLYQIISIDGDTLRYEARTATGKLYDAFRLKKREGQSNEMTEEVPPVPENRRQKAQ